MSVDKLLVQAGHGFFLAVMLFQFAIFASRPGSAQDITLGIDPAPIVPKQSHTQYVPITGTQRLKWFVRSTVGVESLLFAGPWSAGWGTAFDRPHEYNTSWEGFGQRYGIRLTGVST